MEYLLRIKSHILMWTVWILPIYKRRDLLQVSALKESQESTLHCKYGVRVYVEQDLGSSHPRPLSLHILPSP